MKHTDFLDRLARPSSGFQLFGSLVARNGDYATID